MRLRFQFSNSKNKLAESFNKIRSGFCYEEKVWPESTAALREQLPNTIL